MSDASTVVTKNPIQPVTASPDIVSIINSKGVQGLGALISPQDLLVSSQFAQALGSVFTLPDGNTGRTAFTNPDASGYSGTTTPGTDYALIHLSSPESAKPLAVAISQISPYATYVQDNGTVATQTGLNELPPDTIQGPVGPSGPQGFWLSADSSSVIGVITAQNVGPNVTEDLGAEITAQAKQQIGSWISAADHPTPASSAAAAFSETINGAVADPVGISYSGPVAGVYYELLALTPENINVTAHSPGCFIHTGSGTDAIQASSGTNVLDGGTGSNFLTGGTGTDTFFVDARGATADTWSTVANFHSGDAATLWGVSAATPAQWFDSQGAAGYTGLTLHAGAAGGPTASITLAGFSAADLTNGKITASFGQDTASGSSYLYLHKA